MLNSSKETTMAWDSEGAFILKRHWGVDVKQRRPPVISLLSAQSDVKPAETYVPFIVISTLVRSALHVA
jgi:hypothetical protein